MPNGYDGRDALLLVFGYLGSISSKQCLLRNYFLHLGQDLLTLCTLFGGALLIISKPKLLAAHHPSPDLDFAPILTQVACVLQGLP